MTHTNLVASEMTQAGFRTQLFGGSVLVSLQNRKVSTMEVKIALEQIFAEINFTVQSTTDAVLVSW